MTCAEHVFRNDEIPFTALYGPIYLFQEMEVVIYKSEFCMLSRIAENLLMVEEVL